jgi:hypothetical protein
LVTIHLVTARSWMSARYTAEARWQKVECFFCGFGLGQLSTEMPEHRRIAFDPRLGRLWHVCPSCMRWTAAPFEDRWEILEACERAAQRGSSILLQTEHLCLLRTRRAQLIRIGSAPRAEFAGWRYSSLLDAFALRAGLLGRLLRLPLRPAGGNIGADYHGGVATLPLPWIGSPFVEHSGLLAALFSSAPLAPSCPACDDPLLILPHEFATLRLTMDAGHATVLAECALCGAEVGVPVRAARPTLRIGLAIVNRPHRDPEKVVRAVTPVDRSGGADAYVARLARGDVTLGALSPKQRLALWISLDESAETEALEAEWRHAEELASIADGELTEVPGFATFRARIRSSNQ